MSIELPYHQNLLNDGYVIVPKVLPKRLIDECQTEYGPLATLARAQYGWQAQRFQPLESARGYRKDLLNKVKANVRLALELAFNEERTCCNPRTCGVLINPGQPAYGPGATDTTPPSNYVMPRHRDWFNQKAHADIEHLVENWSNWSCWYQFNLAFYDDSSLFVVPGSHKYIDLVEEAQRSQPPRYLQPKDGSDPHWVENYWREQDLLFGAVQVQLQAGDIVIYHAGMLHGSGNWVKRDRLTLHDFCDTPQFNKFREHQYRAWQIARDSEARPWWQSDTDRLTRLSIRPVSDDAHRHPSELANG